MHKLLAQYKIICEAIINKIEYHLILTKYNIIMNEVNIIRDALSNILYKNNDNDVITIIKK